MHKPRCAQCPDHPTLRIARNEIANYLSRHGIQCVEHPTASNGGMFLFDNHNGLALRLVKSYFRKDAH